MPANTLEELLNLERYGDCLTMAEDLLRYGLLGNSDRPVVLWALSRCLAELKAGQEAIGPGELAVYFSRECGQFDLLGRALVHLAALYCDNRLHKRALSVLEEYFRYFSLYHVARKLEGQVFHLLALCFQATGRKPKALEYHVKAYSWHDNHVCDALSLDRYRAALAWHYLQMGKTEPVPALLEASETYLEQAPNDLEARACLWNSRAHLFCMRGVYRAAIDMAVQVLNMRGVAPARKAQAFLILHYTAKAMGSTRIALGIGMLAKIQATVARSFEVEDEISRSMFQTLQQEGLPLMDELLHELSRISKEETAGQCQTSGE